MQLKLGKAVSEQQGQIAVSIQQRCLEPTSLCSAQGAAGGTARGGGGSRALWGRHTWQDELVGERCGCLLQLLLYTVAGEETKEQIMSTGIDLLCL